MPVGFAVASTLAAAQSSALCFRLPPATDPVCVRLPARGAVPLRARVEAWERKLRKAFSLGPELDFGASLPMLSSAVFPLPMVAREPRLFSALLAVIRADALTLSSWTVGTRYAWPGSEASTLPLLSIGEVLEGDRALEGLQRDGLLLLQLPPEGAAAARATARAASRFFDLDNATKRGTHHRYEGKGKEFGWVREKAREFFNLRRASADYRHELPWGPPALNAEMRDACEALYDTLETVGGRVLSALEASLHLSPGSLRDAAPMMDNADDGQRRYGVTALNRATGQQGNPLSDSYARIYRYTPREGGGAAGGSAGHGERVRVSVAGMATAAATAAASGGGEEPPTVGGGHKAHVDVGLLTLAPLSDTRGLQVLGSAGVYLGLCTVSLRD
jgi:hypothetical protein